MPRQLSVEFLTGPRTGQRVQFSLAEHPKIIFGTDPEAQVSFPSAEDSEVSRRHGAVVFDPAADSVQWFDSSRAGTWCGGRRESRLQLAKPVEIALGKDGPRLRLEVIAIPAAPAGASAAPAPARRVEAAVTPPPVKRPVMHPLHFAGAAVAVVVVLAFIVLRLAPTRHADESGAAEKMERLIRATKEELRNEASASGRKLDEQLREARRQMQGTLLDVDSSIATASGKAEAAAKQAANLKSDAEVFAEVARKCERSVALVRGAGGSATAFAIGPEVFATNSHVSTPVSEALARGESCWLVLNKSGGKRLRITRAEVHPRYNDKSRKPGIGHDVGLLFTSEKAASWISIAPDDALAKLDAGHPVCYIGFPSEGLSGGNLDEDDPVATMKRGILTSVTDWEMRDSGGARNQLLRHDMGSAGGASGSPILDREGRVVGIHNAGNYFFLKEAPRIPNAANINFAQRIDCLKDIWPDYPKK